ncbi:epididymal sperm-binding protein 1-like [Actinia tenebrosa]|uniref:Epididymal sperm-binding protein 1-like n=1 Tax=Actinia tenebrosa TaxID=6105 RepID=A0A6P8HCV8_ACTTE|nr:epididymal sperm-binding protein 1-like [Actinia tenebrosa]
MAHWNFVLFALLQSVLVTSLVSGQMTTSGENCTFPFTYRDIVYNSCTTKNHNRPWCSTTANYDTDKKWGNCAGFAKSGVETTRGESCAFPFIYRGVVYNSCTTAVHFLPWCSTTVNYDKDKKWSNCAGFSSGVSTESGGFCVFPFTYKGQEYKSCITKGNKRPWCSTTANYDKDRKNDTCKGFFIDDSRTTSGEYCAFPFVYKGQHYNTWTLKNHDRFWCSTTTNYDEDKKWGNIPFGKGERIITLTTTGEYCVFPFVYEGRQYNNCTSKNHHRPWCSVTANYDKEKEWGDCIY